MIPIHRKQAIIGGATLVAVMLVAGAYYGKSGFGATETLSAEETEAVLKEYAAKDTDGDGVPDWQELLYHTDPQNPHSVRADLTDKEAFDQGLVTATLAPGQNTVGTDIASSIDGTAAAPGTLTEAFAITFFESYVKTGGSAAQSDAALKAFVQSAVDEVVKNQERSDAYGPADFAAAGSATAESYLAGAGKAFASHALSLPYGEMTYFSDAVLKGDAGALLSIRKIGDHYEAIAADLARVPAPTALLSAHRTLANAVAALGKTINDMAALKDDPVRAMIGFGNYEKDGGRMVAALQSLKTAYDATGAAKTGEGASFYALLEASMPTL